MNPPEWLQVVNINLGLLLKAGNSDFIFIGELDNNIHPSHFGTENQVVILGLLQESDVCQADMIVLNHNRALDPAEKSTDFVIAWKRETEGHFRWNATVDRLSGYFLFRDGYVNKEKLKLLARPYILNTLGGADNESPSPNLTHLRGLGVST
ncbi:hypothetical protein C0995_012918 [Termitomyces sp. Mi166|nr:hypothetical protein C0995_012918 [Termitomyces sp. Mi166\